MDFGSKSSEKYRAMEVCFVATNKLNQAKGTCTGKTCDERMRTLCFSPIFPLLFLIGTAYISRYHTYSYIIYAFRPHRCDRLRSDCWMTGTYRNPRPGWEGVAYPERNVGWSRWSRWRKWKQRRSRSWGYRWYHFIWNCNGHVVTSECWFGFRESAQTCTSFIKEIAIFRLVNYYSSARVQETCDNFRKSLLFSKGFFVSALCFSLSCVLSFPDGKSTGGDWIWETLEVGCPFDKCYRLL